MNQLAVQHKFHMTTTQSSDEFYMQAALEQARLAFDADEVPIGAVIVDPATGHIIARAFNRTLDTCDPTAHAEMIVLREACRDAQAQRIPEYDLYVTLEPCPMCAAAISFARIRRLVFGATDPKSGGLTHGPCLYNHAQLHHKPSVTDGVLAEHSAMLLQDFFKAKRQKQKDGL